MDVFQKVSYLTDPVLTELLYIQRHNQLSESSLMDFFHNLLTKQFDMGNTNFDILDPLVITIQYQNRRIGGVW